MLSPQRKKSTWLRDDSSTLWQPPRMRQFCDNAIEKAKVRRNAKRKTLTQMTIYGEEVELFSI